MRLVLSFVSVVFFLLMILITSELNPLNPMTSPGQTTLAEDAPNCRYIQEDFGPSGTVEITVEKWITGLEVPWSIAFISEQEALVTERPGRIRLIRNGELIEQSVAQVNAARTGEQGLLGIALHPQFASNRLFYFYVTAARGGEVVNQIWRYRLSADHLSATADKLILNDLPAGNFHDGGRMKFGPDGMLYVSVGDARNADDAQDPNSPSGKILRLTPNGDVPADNPFPGSAAFLLGVRNSEGFDWLNPSSLVVLDHGPSGEYVRFGHDELTIAKSGDNLGWPKAWKCQSKPGMSAPALVWKEAVPPGGAIFYRGNMIREWKGSMLVATLRSKHLHRIMFGPGAAADGSQRVVGHEVYLEGDPPQGYGRLRDVVQGPDGAVYVTTSNCDHRGECPVEKDMILRITRD